MLAAVLTVSGPWLPARWRRWWWALLLAFVPIHLVVSAVVPARSLLGLAVGWFVGALVVLVVGTPALEVPLDERRPRAGPTRFRGRRDHGGAPGRARTARPVGDGRRNRIRPRSSRCTARTNAAAGRCASSGRSSDCAAAKPRPCRPRCAAPSNIARSWPSPSATSASPTPRRSPSPRSTGDGRSMRTRLPAESRSTNARSDTRCRACGNRCACCTTIRSPTVTCAARRSPSTTAPCASAASAAPSTAPPTPSSNPTSPNSW